MTVLFLSTALRAVRVAAEAVQLVGGDRNRAYAHPAINFQRIARHFRQVGPFIEHQQQIFRRWQHRFRLQRGHH